MSGLEIPDDILLLFFELNNVETLGLLQSLDFTLVLKNHWNEIIIQVKNV